MPAYADQRHYTAGDEFFIVVCDDCLTALNSGHHYPRKDLHHAEALASKHNAEEHDGARYSGEGELVR